MIRRNDIAISIAIMAHPSRAAAVEAQLAAHADLGMRIAYDPEPEHRHSLSTAIAAWSLAASSEATHHLVIQDDVILCDDFADHVLHAVARRPDDAISLFAEWGSRAGDLVRLAALRGDGFAATADPYTPTQALVLPIAEARAFPAYAQATSDPDDIVMYRFLRERGVQAVVTAPNLVEHDDRPSLTGNAFQGRRHSACFLRDPGARRSGSSIAGADLAYLPHVSWMRLVSEWFGCRTGQEITWSGTPLGQRLPDRPGLGELTRRFADQLAVVDPDGDVRASIRDIVLFEVWLGTYALGLVSDVTPEHAGRHGDAVWDQALASVFPGAFRRYLPDDALDRLGPAVTELMRLAVVTATSDAAGMDEVARRSVAHADPDPARRTIKDPAYALG